ncbi:alpha/beta hydrolase [Pedobacter sp. P351]|uniref:alpha/beta hydrolase n=1 Tax=Pedobacter superstes TaxID=3133441 RepID=UPI0030A530BD
MVFRGLKGLVLFLFVVSVASCKKNDVQHEPLKAGVMTDVSYGADQKNRMDVYLPQGRAANTKVIILLHGGAWSDGDKNEYTAQSLYFRDKGFAVINMNYRLAGTAENNIHPAQQADIGAVVNYVSVKASEWNISSDKFGLIGVSAGAHLALLYTYGYNVNDKIKSVVSASGPANFTDTQGIGLQQAAAVQLFLGAEFNQINFPLFVQASPLLRANSLSKPTLILHGLRDDIVPVKQANDLGVKLAQLNVKHKVVLFDEGHELLTPSNSQKILDEIEKWFNETI